MIRPGILLALVSALGSPASARASDRAASDLVALSESFFKEYCIRCHGPARAKGDLRLDRLDHDLSRPTTFEHWRAIADRIRSGEMPPKKGHCSPITTTR